LQTLVCSWNQLTSLEPLHGLKSLKILWCSGNPSLSEPEIERFQKAVPSCEYLVLELDEDLDMEDEDLGMKEEPI